MPEARIAVLWCGVCCCLLALVSGCGGPDLGSPATVTGKVTVDGQPLSDATVTFHCIGERAAEFRTFTTTTDVGGEYTIDKIYPGSYSVGVGESAPGADGGDPGMASATAGDELKPADGGDLSAEVTSDDLVFDVQLTRQ
ncbi:MAG: carboxypeptidase regulatory-like domain-containing protein [Planctomycetes bacterium]|nr:carboxypeptidase regulatory-like domain-containing protein [Planctomycetota bacterium]